MTIYNLHTRCKDFHIVLVLSSDEFPQKEKELPNDLITMLNNNIFELLWVEKNYKAFKKILFTMEKYKDLPVISADDDCLYKINYAQILYDEWLKHKDCVISFSGRQHDGIIHTCGRYTLYPPYCFKEYGTKFLTDYIINLVEDDKYYSALKKVMGIKSIVLNKYRQRNICSFSNTESPLTNIYRKKNLDEAYKKSLDYINANISK